MRGGKRGLVSRLTRQDTNSDINETKVTTVVQARERREREQGPSRGGWKHEQGGRRSISEGEQGQRGKCSQFGGEETGLDGEGWRAENWTKADKAALVITGLPSPPQRTKVSSILLMERVSFP